MSHGRWPILYMHARGYIGAGEGDSVAIVKVTFFSSHLRSLINPNGESNRFRVPEISVPQVNDALLTRHSDGAPTEHRMTVTIWSSRS